MTTEHSEIDDHLMSVLQDASTQTDHSSDDTVALPSSTPNPVTDQTIEAGPLPSTRPYQCYGRSKGTDIGAETIEPFHGWLSMYVHGDAEALHNLIDYLLESKKWTSMFRGSKKKEEDSLTSKFLSSFVKEYQECKRKETVLFRSSKNSTGYKSFWNRVKRPRCLSR